jgi:GAF domain-containing protein
MTDSREEEVMAADTDGFIELLASLTRLMVDEETLEETLARVAYLACSGPIDANNAGVTLQRERGPATAAYHGDAALPLDQAQYDDDDGPCLTAFRTGEVVVVGKVSQTADRWPAFAASAANHGIQSSLSLPLTVRDEIVGALNMYSSTPEAFDAQSVDLGQRFAQQAAVAISNADVYWRTFALTQNLETALENRDRIGQAKGILIATNKITGDAAFDILRRTSQNLNVKLREVADYVVRTGQLPESAEDCS